VQVERRPLVLVKAVTGTGDTISVILQNAETVKLVCKVSTDAHLKGTKDGMTENSCGVIDALAEKHRAPQWRAVAVTELTPGCHAFILPSTSGRHMGMAINETLSEV
jgi:3-dehydroquinate synthase class II